MCEPQWQVLPSLQLPVEPIYQLMRMQLCVAHFVPPSRTSWVDSVLNDQHIHLKKKDLIDSPLLSLNSHDKRYCFTSNVSFLLERKKQLRNRSYSPFIRPQAWHIFLSLFFFFYLTLYLRHNCNEAFFNIDFSSLKILRPCFNVLANLTCFFKI